MKRLAAVLAWNTFFSGQEKLLRTIAPILFAVLSIVLGVGFGFGCDWRFDTLTNFSEAFLSQQFAELMF